MKIEPVGEDGVIRIRPIGTVRSPVESEQFGGFKDVDSVIELHPEFADYVVGLEDYSHITVVYWLSGQTESHGLHRPQGRPDAPVVGMFACR